jgi:hypothetical protein
MQNLDFLFENLSFKQSKPNINIVDEASTFRYDEIFGKPFILKTEQGLSPAWFIIKSGFNSATLKCDEDEFLTHFDGSYVRVKYLIFNNGHYYYTSRYATLDDYYEMLDSQLELIVADELVNSFMQIGRSVAC